MATFTAYTLAGDGSAPRPVSLPDPVIEEGEILLETQMTEVCGTDLHLQSGAMRGVPYPVIPGHFMVGNVAQVKGHRLDIDGRLIVRGDTLVFLDVHGTCGHCWHCTSGATANRCQHRQVYGVTHSVREGPFGGWSQKVLIRSNVHCAMLPVGLSPERYIAGGCALPTAFHALERARLQLLDLVLVQGAGPVGLSIALLARASGAGDVIILDHSEARLRMAEKLGFQHLACRRDNLDSATSLVRSLGDARGVDVAFEATGSPQAIPEGLSLLRDGGRYVVVGQYADRGEMAINPHLHINKKHVTILGVWGIELRHFRRMIQILSRPPSTLDPALWDMLATHYPLHEVERALADIRDGLVTKAILTVGQAARGLAGE
jgi:threonine dehydrogenase-like Zn-dependent dehydrogenase